MVNSEKIIHPSALCMYDERASNGMCSLGLKILLKIDFCNLN